MRMRHLRDFLAVAEEQSFTHAAARIHVEPSSLSRAIQELENVLKTRLLHRGKGRIRLTVAGEMFREDARRLLAFMEEARQRARSSEKGCRRCLRLGLADALAQPRLTRLLARCREEEPLTLLRVIEMTASEMRQALDHERIDAGIALSAGLDETPARSPCGSIVRSSPCPGITPCSPAPKSLRAKSSASP